MFSAAATSPVTLSGMPRLASADITAITAAPPAISVFIAFMPSFGFSDRPPLSKVIPLPTKTTCRRAPGGEWLSSISRGGRSEPEPTAVRLPKPALASSWSVHTLTPRPFSAATVLAASASDCGHLRTDRGVGQLPGERHRRREDDRLVDRRDGPAAGLLRRRALAVAGTGHEQPQLGVLGLVSARRRLLRVPVCAEQRALGEGSHLLVWLAGHDGGNRPVAGLQQPPELAAGPAQRARRTVPDTEEHDPRRGLTDSGDRVGDLAGLAGELRRPDHLGRARRAQRVERGIGGHFAAGSDRSYNKIGKLQAACPHGFQVVTCRAEVGPAQRGHSTDNRHQSRCFSRQRTQGHC